MTQTKIVPAEPTISQEIERLRSDNAELGKEAAWIRNKLGLPSDVKFLSGDITLAGTMHKIVSHAKGYVTYIEAFKCDDKQGEIARQSVRITSLESHNRELLAVNQVLREALQAAQSAIDCYDYTDTKDVSDKYIKAERLCAEALAIKTKSNTE